MSYWKHRTGKGELPFRIFYRSEARQLGLSWQNGYLPVSAAVVTVDGKAISVPCPRDERGFELDFSRYEAGSYLLRLLDRNGMPRTARFVVLR